MPALWSPPLSFRHADGWCVDVAGDVVARWRSVVGDVREAGGVLLGTRFDGCDDLSVDAVTLPQPGDRRTATSYYRHAPAHQRHVERAWSESGGFRVYLGEWHSHPTGAPVPSATDLLTWARFAGEAERLPLVFFVVASTGVAAWGTATKGELRPLSRVQVSDGPGG